MSETSPDWDAVRTDYEGGGGTLVEIEARYGISREQLTQARRRGHWTPRRPLACHPKKPNLIARLMGVLDCQVQAMEATLAQGNEVDAAQMRLLETMVKTLEKLTALQRAEATKAQTRKKSRSPGEVAALRKKLAERIAALSRD